MSDKSSQHLTSFDQRKRNAFQQAGPKSISDNRYLSAQQKLEDELSEESLQRSLSVQYIDDWAEQYDDF